MAGESAADEVDRGEVLRADFADVFESDRIGEMAGEDCSAMGVSLDLPGDAHPCPLEAEIEATDAREEAPDIHAPPLGAALKIGT